MVLAGTVLLSGCDPSDKAVYRQTRAFLERVYQTMEANYYQPLDPRAFEKFLLDFQQNIYPRMKREGRSRQYIRWRAASYMIQALKTDEDIFSEFYPPKPAQKYETSALGKVAGPRRDLGVRGKIVRQGLLVTFVEPRADAYARGLREGDVVTEVAGRALSGLDEQAIRELMRPAADAVVELRYFRARDRQERTIEVKAKEFFKLQVFPVPVRFPGIYCLKLEHFNRKTAEDMFRYLKFFRRKGEIKGLILDLRNNPGGPPLAVREIASFFLPGGEEMASFRQKGKAVATLDIPAINEKYKYHGPIVILINRKSGSSSELFSGIMQRRRRAFLMGDRSAGQVMLKRMFPFEDGSMALLITARGTYPDGEVFSFEGLSPDKEVAQDVDWVDYAARFLYYVRIRMQRRSQSVERG